MKIMDPPQERVALLSSDEGGGSTEDGCSGDSSEDEVTEHRVAEDLPQQPPARPPPPYIQPNHLPNMAAAHAQVPIISVTPHSPGVLDDSLQQLRRLHAAVQRMRTAPLPQLIGSNRLSSSCPSLVKDGELGQEECYSPSATPSHLDYYPQSRKGSGESRHWAGWDVGGDEGRRRSWAALDATPRMGEVRRQRSMSLSSMESDGELESVGGVPRITTARRSRQAQSTHSLNEADLQKDFAAVALALRSGLGVGGGAVTEPLVPPAAARALPARLQPRLPLQKSVSTPSIVAAIQPALQPTAKGNNDLSVGGATDTESEEEDDTSAATVGGSTPSKGSALVKSTASRRSSKHPEHLGLHQLEFLAQTSYDHNSEKRRKRGSLFFRKKKDKSRKASHIWQAANAGGDCDWCGRVLSDKPSLYCENCTTTVHQNICKDYIVECTKPKTSKTSVTKSLSTNSGKNSKRSSISNQSQAASTYVNHDDKEGSDHKHDQSNVSDDAMGAEWPEARLTADQLGVEAGTLLLGAPEPDTWGAGAPRALARTLTEREQKRQEHIYELVLTEKHHCLTVRLMQKMFLEGMVRGAGVSSAQGARMFPRLADLWSLHAALLARLRQRQAASPNVPTISDILLDNFTGATAAKFKSAYGEFCSRHRDAVDVFKDCCAREPKVARFIRKCQTNPLLRKKGVPECVLFVAQRLTKYPLLLEPLLKTAGDDQLERERLQRALAGVKEILVDVDGQVAAKEREDRKLEIYHRIDAKSFAIYRGRKFKKSDILQGNRSLKFEGTATLMQGRSKMQTLLVIVLTDCLFFLHDNNNKYTFFTPDNKTGVVSLQKLLVREKAGADGRGLYIICSSPSEPEMFELRVHKPKDLAHWITPIRAAVQCCPEDEEDSEMGVQSAEERQKQLEAREKNITTITDVLRSKDKEHALLLEDKMALHMRLVAAVGNTGGHVAAPPPPADMAHMGLSTAFPGGLVPEYMKWASPSTDTHALWQEVCKVVKEAMDVCAVAWGAMGAAGAALGRSTSSAGERHSSAYESPALPRRAETFGGFDNQHAAKVRRPTDEDGEKHEEQQSTTEQQQQEQQHPHPQLEPHAAASLNTALKLQHCIYTLTCIVWQQLTTIHSLEAQMWASRGGSGSAPGGAGGVLQQLEELREAQARLTQERAAWDTQRQADADALAAERRMLARATQQLSEQQRDVEQQRERLYRRLERLQQQQHGGSQEEVASVGTLSPESSITDNGRRKDTPKWRASRGSTGSECSVSSSVPAGVLPPPQLLSAQNEMRATAAAATQHIPLVKQQLPLKLASGKSQAGHTHTAATLPPAGYQRLHDSSTELNSGLVIHHTRTGSSPANISQPHIQQINNKATRTNTYPKLPDKFRIRSTESQGSVAHTPQPSHTAHTQEEEVIFF